MTEGKCLPGRRIFDFINKWRSFSLDTIRDDSYHSVFLRLAGRLILRIFGGI